MTHFYSFALFAMLGVVLAQSAAFAGREDVSHMAAIRHDITEARKLTKFQGALSCPMGESNDGQGCSLTFKETATGRIFQLRNHQSAMRLFQDGRTQVAIEGTLADGETISVEKIQSL